jgi:hypothetical protein
VSTNFGKQYAEEEEIEDIKGVIKIRKSKKIDKSGVWSFRWCDF